MSKSLSNKIIKRWRHILFGYMGRGLLTLIGYTCRFKFEGVENFVTAAGQKKCILMFWHSRLMMTAEILKRIAPQNYYAALISNSRDGEIIAALTNSYRHGRTIRVPHDGRAAALKALIDEMRKNNDVIIITPDGPRGPAQKVKPGIVLAAKKCKAEVFPLSWNSNRYWKLPTWDGMILPKPFSTLQVKLGPPVSLEEHENEKNSKGAEVLESALLALERESTF